MKHVAIIGNGVAGVTAARHVRKMSDAAITIISAESDHFYSRTALMYIYMGALTYQGTKPYEDRFWQENRIDLLRGYVEGIDTEERNLLLRDGRTVPYDSLLVATGSRPRPFGCPGEELDGVQGLYGLDDLERMERNTAGIGRGVVVGGGLIGVEVAEMLHSRGIPVTFLVRERTYMAGILPWEEGMMVDRHLRGHGIDLRAGVSLREILPDANGRVRAVVTADGEEIPCEFVALTIGVEPNLDIVAGSGIETGRGVLVDEFFGTNVPGVYAAGDCAEFRNPPPGEAAVEQLWYTARQHGEIVARNICGVPTPYRRGVWFNSAKFFDIEYQTYGRVAPLLGEGERTLYWEHPEGNRAIRINYLPDSRRVIGFNLMGVRYRHQVCDGWIREGRPVEYVLANLGAANFDPEFYPEFEKHVVEIYNSREEGTPVHLGRRRGLRERLFGRGTI